MKRLKILAGIFLCSLSCSACQSYYAVTDLHTKDLYYTHGNLWLMERRHGGLEFQELFTGDDIRLDNARAHEINAQEVQKLLSQHSDSTQPKSKE